MHILIPSREVLLIKLARSDTGVDQQDPSFGNHDSLAGRNRTKLKKTEKTMRVYEYLEQKLFNSILTEQAGC